MELTEKKPKVSVCVVTYNQEKYIRQCLQSIVDQVTNFDFEVIVGDDCSTDGTPEIVQEFSKRYPEIVKPVIRFKNIGASENFIDTHNLAGCEYVCHMDGDDYWLPGKLQYQVDILNCDKSIVQCWTCAKVVGESGEFLKIFPSRLARIFYPHHLNAEDLVLSYALVGQHSTQMYRRSARRVNSINSDSLDFYVAFINSLSGTSFYSKKIYSAYRVGVENSVTRNTSKSRVTVDLLAKHLGEIINDHPFYLQYAVANLFARRFFSRWAGHDLSAIDKIIAEVKIQPKTSLLLKSSFYFLLQKIF